MNSNKVGLVFLLACGMFINAIDRGALGVAAPQMLKDLNVDPGVMGLALSAFYCSYIVCMVPVGRLADKYGAEGDARLGRRLLVGGVGGNRVDPGVLWLDCRAPGGWRRRRRVIR